MFITGNPRHNSKDIKDSRFPVLHYFQPAEGSSAILWMTNFTCREFHKIHGMFLSQINSDWNNGSGTKSTFIAQDFFSWCYVLKRGCPWNFPARLFKIKTNTFEKMISSCTKVILDWSLEEKGLMLENFFKVNDFVDEKTFFFVSVRVIRYRCKSSVMYRTWRGCRQRKALFKWKA